MAAGMENNRVLTHLPFPVAVSTPSPRNIQWSEDGQLFVLSRNTILILTPEFNSDIALFSFLDPRPSKTREFPKDVKWYTNRIEIDKTLHHNWASESDDWGTLSLGSLDVSWIGMALSPTNASKGHCCVLAALTSNLEISLWSPFKNHISGEWQKIQDVTQTIKDSIVSFDNKVHRVQIAQVHCMAWSKGLYVVSPGNVFDGSILALGNRAGSILYMKYARETGLSYLKNIQVADNWVVDITWSSWSQKEDDCQSAFVFCSIADGSVYKIQMEISGHSQNLEMKFINSVERLHPVDFTPTTALSLIQHQTYNPVIVYTKPGVVNLQRISQHSHLEWDEPVVLTFPIQSSLPKQDLFAAIAGIIYYDGEDYMEIHASDGTVYRISDVMNSPNISIEDKFVELGNEIQIFRLSKDELVDKIRIDDRIYISGVVGLDHAEIFGWFYECRQPNDFSYKLDSQHISYFSFVQLQESKMLLREHLSNHLSTVNETLTYHPSFRLRESLIYLNHSLLTDGEIKHVWELLQRTPTQTTLDVQPSAFSKSPQSTLSLGLFRDPKFSGLRFKLTLVHSLLRNNLDHSLVRDFIDGLTQSIKHLYMQAVLQWLQSMTPWKGTSNDNQDFMLRWLVLCHTSGELLQREATVVAATMGISGEFSSQNTKICESCPACHVTIPVNSGDEAVCENGHRWQRCSISSFILATPNVRTCVGCRRKSLLPRSLKVPSDMENQDWLPSASQSEFVNDLLEAVHWCTYCENRFVRLL